MPRELTKGEKELFLVSWIIRFKGNEAEPYYMPYDEYEKLCSFMDLDEKQLIIPDGMTEIKYGPFNRSFLKKIVIPGSVKIIGHNAFRGCDGLEELIISSGVEEIMEAAFLGCDNLKRIVLPSSIKLIGSEAFAYCENLEEIVIQNGVEDIGYNAFSYNNHLTSITVPVTVKNARRICDGCNRLKKIELPLSLVREDESVTGHAECAKVYYFN